MKLVITQNITLDGVVEQNDDPRWENSTVLTGDLRDEVGSLKGLPGGNLGVTGSISVCHELIRVDLVDEYRLLVYPVVVGQGRRLFDGHGLATRAMELVATQRFE